MLRTAVCSILLALAMSASGGCTSIPPTRSSKQYDHNLRRTVEYLASDELEGRGVDTAGIDRAADYIAGSFRQIGAQPLAAHGYFQSFDMTVGASVGEQTALRIGEDDELELATDYAPVSFSAEASFDAPVVFVGYGISSPRRGYDDYGGVDVAGKVALAMRFEPHDARGGSRFQDKGWSGDATLTSKARAAAEHGAAALLLVNPPEFHGADSLLPFATAFKGPRAAIPVIHISQQTAGRLLARAGRDLAKLQSAIDETGKPASTALEGARAAGAMRIQRNTRSVKNVVAILPGMRAGADEYVIVGAHYDHVGRGTLASMTGSTEIHNGADDNASGVAAMLELAERIRSDPPLDRSVLFVAFVAEEWGLLGSQHFVAHPPVPLQNVAAMVNMDMVGRVRKGQLYVGGYGTAAPLKNIIDAAGGHTSIQVMEMGAGGMGPSDHMSFAMKKIPVLFLFSGMHADYHRPSDDAEKINYAGIERVVDFAERTVRDLAAMPRAQYVDSSDAHSARIASPTGSKMMLGVVPDYSEESSAAGEGGVRIQGIVAGSPAALAGLKSGDVIRRFGDKPVRTLYDLTQFIAGARPDQTIVLTVDREGRTVRIEAVMRLPSDE